MSDKKHIVEAMTELFNKRVKELYDREKAEPEFLNQKDFRTCTDRVKAGLNPIFDEISDMAALATLDSRESKQGDDRTAEKAYLESKMEQELVAAARASGGSWGN